MKTLLSAPASVLFSVLGLLAVNDAGFALTILAEQAQVKTMGGIQDGAWNLWSPGEWADFVHFETPGTCQIRVLCFGSPADGAWPDMAFTVDGANMKTVTVATSEPTEYVFELEAEAADYRIGVSFLNDAMTATEDRNLYIVSLSVAPLGNGPEPALVSEQIWRQHWGKIQRQREAAILAKATQAIEVNRKTDATLRVVGEDGRPAAGADIRVDLVRHDFLFGGNIFRFDRFGAPRENEAYRERFRELFNYATTGFYWRWYEPVRGQPDYGYTDRVVAWCAANAIRLKGHPLLWADESGVPTWAREQPAADVQRQRVTDIMTRYAGKIESWEVVNEPAHLPGLAIDAPYRWAREVNPKAYLIVNDYQVMADGYPPFFTLLQQALDRGVPFDGIGIQAHEPRTLRFPLDQVWNALDHYATLGKELHITEFTPTSGGQPITGSHLTGAWDEAAQADYAAKFYTVCFAHPAVAAITWWDLCDDGAWLEGGGLLRRDLSPKPAYLALRHLIREQWVTTAQGKTDPDGKFSFRGFRGTYNVRITRHEKTLEHQIHLGNAEPKTIRVDLE